jgi:hypothetical protein
MKTLIPIALVLVSFSCATSPMLVWHHTPEPFTEGSTEWEKDRYQCDLETLQWMHAQGLATDEVGRLKFYGPQFQTCMSTKGWHLQKADSLERAKKRWADSIVRTMKIQ